MYFSDSHQWYFADFAKFALLFFRFYSENETYCSLKISIALFSLTTVVYVRKLYLLITKMLRLFRMGFWFQFSPVCYSPMIYSRQVNDNANDYTVWLSWHVVSHSNNTCQVMLYVIVETEYCQNQEKHDCCTNTFITGNLMIQIINGNSR